MVKLNYVGVVDDLDTWEVIDAETGQIIGYNQKAKEE
jgi:hypothetical protein